MNATKIPENYKSESVKDQLDQLRKSGWQVSIQHWRYLSAGKNKEAFLAKKNVMKDFCNLFNNQFKSKIVDIAPRGGQTRVDIRRNGQHLFATAVCSKNDMFCYRTGAGFALYRIFEMLKNNEQLKS